MMRMIGRKEEGNTGCEFPLAKLHLNLVDISPQKGQGPSLDAAANLAQSIRTEFIRNRR